MNSNATLQLEIDGLAFGIAMRSSKQHQLGKSESDFYQQASCLKGA